MGIEATNMGIEATLVAGIILLRSYVPTCACARFLFPQLIFTTVRHIRVLAANLYL